MIIKEILDKALSSEQFKEWEKGNSHLAHVFKIYDKENQDTWQIGFYNPDDDKMVPIEIEKDEIRIGQESEIFKKQGKISSLDMDKVKFDITDILEIAKTLQQEKYKGQEPTKIIVILQNIEGKDIYNVTYVTRTFKTLNIRIDANTSEVISENLTSIFEFKVNENKKDTGR